MCGQLNYENFANTEALFAAGLSYVLKEKIRADQVRRVGLLEQALEVTLFERLPSGVSLTEAGETFLPFARQALVAVKDSQEAMGQFKQTVRGTVKLAMVGTLANTDLTDKLHRLCWCVAKKGTCPSARHRF